MKPVAAAIKGTQEIGFAVIAMTLTLAAVYAPIAFAPGRTGRLFLEFALTLAGAVLDLGLRRADADADDVLASCCKHDPKPAASFNIIERAFDGARASATGGALRPRWLSALLVIADALGVAGVERLSRSRASSRSLSPVEDRGRSSRARHRRPRARRWPTPAATAHQVDEHPDEMPEIQSTPRSSTAIPRSSQLPTSRASRTGTSASARSSRSSREIAPKLGAHPGRARVLRPTRALARPARLRQAGRVRDAVLGAPTRSCRSMADHAARSASKTIRASPDIDTDLKLNMPEFRVEMDRDQGRGPRRSTSTSSGARSRRCWAAGRSRASSRTASSTT